MTREELKQYIDNCNLSGNLVNENSEIYKTLHEYGIGEIRWLLANLLGSVYIDGLYVKMDSHNNIHLVYYDGEYETLDLGDCIDIINAHAFTPRALLVVESPSERMQLMSVSGSSVTSIGIGAFQSSSVKEVNFPNVREIGYRCFKESRVEHISFNKLTAISMESFQHSSLISFEGKKVSSVSRGAFESCHNLTHVYLPSVLATNIQDIAFYGCWNLHKDNLIIKNNSDAFFRY